MYSTVVQSYTCICNIHVVLWAMQCLLLIGYFAIFPFCPGGVASCLRSDFDDCVLFGCKEGCSSEGWMPQISDIREIVAAWKMWCNECIKHLFLKNGFAKDHYELMMKTLSKTGALIWMQPISSFWAKKFFLVGRFSWRLLELELWVIVWHG